MEQIRSVSGPARVGYGPELQDYSRTEKFFVKLQPLTREPLSPFEEAVIAAKRISENLGSEITLCMSGGLDSEAMALAFLAAGVRFSVTTLRFTQDLNGRDIAPAVEFCSKNNLQQKFIDLDVVRFFENAEYLNYVEAYSCTGPEVATQIWFADQIKTPFVWGGETFRLFFSDGSPAVQAISEIDAVIARYIKLANRKAVPSFHFYTSELAWSFFRKSIDFKSHYFEDDHRPEFYNEKTAFYRECGFPVRSSSERSEKLHGFEGVKIFFDQKLAAEKGTNYTDFYRAPLKEKYPIQGSSYLDIPKNDLIARSILKLSGGAAP